MTGATPRGMVEAVDSDAITTGTGDQGESALFSGERLPKDDDLFEVLGTIDELASWLGLIKAALRSRLESGPRDLPRVADQIEAIQRDLQRIAAERATSPRSPLYAGLDPVGPEDVARLEGWQRAAAGSIRIPAGFAIPGATRLGAAADIARTVCRRLERRYVAAARRAAPERLAADVALRYLNRLSDYLFVVARRCDAEAPPGARQP